jgi:hypothetical protein
LLRPYPGKADAILFDHVGAVARHTLPEREWSLDGSPKKAKPPGREDFPERLRSLPDAYPAAFPPAPAAPVPLMVGIDKAIRTATAGRGRGQL